jgi:hypothetical protein
LSADARLEITITDSLSPRLTEALLCHRRDVFCMICLSSSWFDLPLSEVNESSLQVIGGAKLNKLQISIARRLDCVRW